jgi:cytochrome c oxidase assembly protein subunit 11
VAPAKASLYFNKTECFCFSRQSLRPGESKRMPVRFVIDPEMPSSINMLTLSYTFFPVAGQQAYGAAGAADLQPDS